MVEKIIKNKNLIWKIFYLIKLICAPTPYQVTKFDCVLGMFVISVTKKNMKNHFEKFKFVKFST